MHITQGVAGEEVNTAHYRHHLDLAEGADARKSSMRELVQEPINTLSIATSVTVKQFVGVRRFQQRRKVIFRFITADPGKDRQQMQIVIPQHQTYVIA